jgi:hypothetical protein
MPQHPHATFDWGTLNTVYTDEFGQIAPDVFAAAGRLWQQAQGYAAHVFPNDDPARVRTLLLKAAAQVTRARDEKAHPINELEGYLFQAFKHVVLAELQKESNRLRFETQAHLNAELRGQIETVERRILLKEIVAAMDEWTREIFDYLTLGYSFDEIGHGKGLNGKALSNKFHRRIKSLMKQIKGFSNSDR